MNKAVVLLSGGVDSTTCLALAVEKYGAENVTAITIKYGQKHEKEIVQAKAVAQYYKVKHEVMDLTYIFAGSNSALLQGSTQEIKHTDYAEQCKESDTGMVNTFVPFRNGVFLAVLGAKAMTICESSGPDASCAIYIGNHGDDAAGNAYADCSVEFIAAMNEAISIGTYHKVSIASPFQGRSKKEVVKTGLDLAVPYELTWSCYDGGDEPCHTCATCRDRERAFEENGTVDPLVGHHE